MIRKFFPLYYEQAVLSADVAAQEMSQLHESYHEEKETPNRETYEQLCANVMSRGRFLVDRVRAPDSATDVRQLCSAAARFLMGEADARQAATAGAANGWGCDPETLTRAVRHQQNRAQVMDVRLTCIARVCLNTMCLHLKVY